MQNVQIFGIRSSQATRAAERFFKERRIPIQFVDLKHKPMSAGEIRRFIDRFGLAHLVDTQSKAFLDSGLKYLRVGDAQMLEKLASEPALLKLPLVRAANLLSVGHDQESWKAMVAG